MTKDDKIIVVFLVSIGLFSTAQAITYVKNLGAKEKKQLISIKDLRNNSIILCEGVTDLEYAETKEGILKS